MKKVSLILAALALVLGISQCKKQEEPAASGQKQHIVLNASFGDSNAKIAEDGIGGLKWTVGDVINVSQNGQSLSDDGLICTDAANGIFEGDINETTGEITFTFGEQNFWEQTGDLNDAISLTAEAPYDKNGNYNVTMNMPHAVLKLDLSAFASNDAKGDGVTVTIQSGDAELASVVGITSASKAVYVALPIEETVSKKYTFTGNGRIFEKAWTLVANAFYTLSGSTTGEAFVIAAYPEGALSGLFTVSDSGTPGDASDDVKVYFSKGNLTYSVTDTKWLFYEHQYDRADNGSASTTLISLFTWGYGDWSTDPTTMEYLEGHTSDGEPFNPSEDWGSQIGDGKTWRTLSTKEWQYLFNTRTMANGGARFENLTSSGITVEGVTFKGVVLFPDDFTDQADWKTKYTTWKALNDARLVFLPAAGHRRGSKVDKVGGYGYYWSSSSAGGDQVYSMRFASGVTPSYSDHRIDGYSVRLITESK